MGPAAVRAFIPVEPYPFQVSHRGFGKLGFAPMRVEVFGAVYQLTTGLMCTLVGGPKRLCVAKVEQSGRCRGEAKLGAST